MAKQFSVYCAKTGELLFEGTAKECSAKFEITERALRAAADRGLRMCSGKYRVMDHAEGEVTSYADLDIIESWDRFVEPLRKLYGVPVYKAPKESKG